MRPHFVGRSQILHRGTLFQFGLHFVGFLVLMLPSIVSANPIFVYKEKGGSIRFSNKPPPSGVSAEVFTAKGLPYSIMGPRSRASFGGRLFSEHYTDIISKASTETKLESALIRAVIHAESGFDRLAVSPKGAQGLMQLMPEVARSWGVRNPFDPVQNVLAGCRYLATLLSKYAGDLKLALAAYNAGPGAVEQYGGVPPYDETRDYVSRVLALKSRYGALGKSLSKNVRFRS